MLKASCRHCARHGHSPALARTRRSWAGRGTSQTPPQLRTPGQELSPAPWRHRQAHVPRQCQGAEHRVPGTHSCIPSFPCPGDAPRLQHAPRGKQLRVCHPASSQQSCSSPGAGHTASLASPVPPCTQSRALLSLQSYQAPWHRSRMHAETMAIRPQNEHLDLKTTNKLKSPHNNKPHTHTQNHPENQIQAEQILSALASCVTDTGQVSPCSWRGNTWPPEFKKAGTEAGTEMLGKLLWKNKEEESRGESQLRSTHEPWTPIQHIRAATAATNPCAKHQQDSHYQIIEKQSFATFSSAWEAGPWHLQTCLPRGFGAWLYLHEFSAEQEPCDHRSGLTRGVVPVGIRAAQHLPVLNPGQEKELTFPTTFIPRLMYIIIQITL